jgi:hypothetical protein
MIYTRCLWTLSWTINKPKYILACLWSRNTWKDVILLPCQQNCFIMSSAFYGERVWSPLFARALLQPLVCFVSAPAPTAVAQLGGKGSDIDTSDGTSFISNLYLQVMIKVHCLPWTHKLNNWTSQCNITRVKVNFTNWTSLRSNIWWKIRYLTWPQTTIWNKFYDARFSTIDIR